MNVFDVFKSVLLGIDAYLTYRTCSRGGRCDVAVMMFMLTVFEYVSSYVEVDRSLVALALVFAILVALVVVGG